MTLLAEAPAGRHFAQFHREQDSLVESVYTFLETGLRRGSSALIIAPPEQVDRLLQRLQDGRFHTRSLIDAGQLARLDSTKILEQLTTRGKPDRALLRAAIAPTLIRLQHHGRGIRVYCELANALWQMGDTEAAICVEEFWNTRAETRQFAVYCGFKMDTQSERSYAGPLEELGRTHGEILGTAEDEEFGLALDRASKEIFGISLTQMAGVSRQPGAHRFPIGQRAMLWVARNLPMSSGQLTERARRYFKSGHA